MQMQKDGSFMARRGTDDDGLDSPGNLDGPGGFGAAPGRTNTYTEAVDAFAVQARDGGEVGTVGGAGYLSMGGTPAVTPQVSVGSESPTYLMPGGGVYDRFGHGADGEAQGTAAARGEGLGASGYSRFGGGAGGGPNQPVVRQGTAWGSDVGSGGETATGRQGTAWGPDNLQAAGRDSNPINGFYSSIQDAQAEAKVGEPAFAVGGRRRVKYNVGAGTCLDLVGSPTRTAGHHEGVTHRACR